MLPYTPESDRKMRKNRVEEFAQICIQLAYFLV